MAFLFCCPNKAVSIFVQSSEGKIYRIIHFTSDILITVPVLSRLKALLFIQLKVECGDCEGNW